MLDNQVLSKYFHSGKAGASKQGELSTAVSVGELSLQLLAGLGLQPQEKEQEGQLHHHQLPTLSCNPAEQPPRAECGRPEERTWRAEWSPARVNAPAGCQT